MKRLLLSLTAMAYVGQVAAMDEAINTKNWNQVCFYIIQADPQTLSLYQRLLLNTHVDLNTFTDVQNALLYNLLSYGLPTSSQNPDDIRTVNNTGFMLKSLIAHGKLDPNTKGGKKNQFIVNYLDQSENRYRNFLQSICDQIAIDQKKQQSKWYCTTLLHDYQSSLEGFKKTVTLKWRPYCLVVDYRVWATVCIAALASHLYLNKKQQHDDHDISDQNCSEDSCKQTNNPSVRVINA